MSRLNKTLHLLKAIIILSCFFFSFHAYADAKDIVIPKLPPLPLYQELLLTVTVNQQPQKDVKLFLMTASNKIYANEKDLKSWRIIKFPQKSITYQGEKYYLLNDFPGATYQVDIHKLTIAINLSSDVFDKTSLKLQNDELVKPTLPPPGAYVNYDFNNQQIQGNYSQQGLFWEPAFFNKYGVGVSDFVTTHTYNSTKNVRLNTNWTHDDPNNMRSYRLGDSFSGQPAWGGSVGFEGVQIARNFSTQPSYITFPLPSSTGRAVLPSMVDLFVNNAMVSSQSINSGPFAIENIPVVNGQGDVTIVTTDILGRQETVTIPYYGSNKILKAGLHDYSFEAGAIRRDFGTASNHYGPSMISGGDSVGITNNLTTNWHAEALTGNQQTAGVGANYLIGNFGIVNASVAESHASFGNGGLVMMGFQRQAFKQVTFGGSVRLTTPNFTQAARQSGEPFPAMQSQIFMGIPLLKGNSLGLSFTAQNNRDETPSTRLATASYSFRVYESLSCSISGSSNVGGERNKAAFALLTLPLGKYLTASSGFQARSSLNSPDNTYYVTNTLTRTQPQGPGWGYRVSSQNGVAGTADSERYQTQVTANSDYGSYIVQANRADDTNGYRWGTSGSIVYMDDQLFFARRIQQSFGVVSLQDMSDVDVYSENQLAGKTNSEGYALLPNLRPYQKNKISIKPENLPMGALLTTDKVEAVPYYRSGTSIRFPIKSGLGVTMKVVDSAGQILPAGTVVNLVDQKDQYMVADDGQVFVSGIVDGENKLEAQYNGQKCVMDIQFKPTEDPLPDLGTVVCKGVS